QGVVAVRGKREVMEDVDAPGLERRQLARIDRQVVGLEAARAARLGEAGGGAAIVVVDAAGGESDAGAAGACPERVELDGVRNRWLRDCERARREQRVDRAGLV